MSYWSEVKEVALKGVDLAIANIKGGAEQALEKGKDSVAYLQLKKDLFLEQRNLHNLLADLGDVTLELYKVKGDFYSSSKIKDIAERVTAVEEKCRSIEEDMKRLSGK